MDEENALKILGFSNTDAKVYVTVAKFGPITASDIIRASGLHRPNVYDSIKRLCQKAYISYIVKNKRKYFQATDLKKTVADIENRIGNIKHVLQSLFVSAAIEKRHNIQVLEGIEGFKFILDDELNTLKRNEEIVVLGIPASSVFMEDVIRKWHKKRSKAGIRYRGLWVRELKSITNKIKLLPNTKIKHLPDNYPFPITIAMYKNKVALLTWSKETPVGILIENERFVKGFKAYFRMLWKISEK